MEEELAEEEQRDRLVHDLIRRYGREFDEADVNEQARALLSLSLSLSLFTGPT